MKKGPPFLEAPIVNIGTTLRLLPFSPEGKTGNASTEEE
jgi:hypothetical protein